MAVTYNPFSMVNNFMNKYQDSRTANWLFMSSPFYTLGICLSYVYIVKVVGPKFMENRKPFQLRKVLIVYNFLQVLFSLYLFLGRACSRGTAYYRFVQLSVIFELSAKMVSKDWVGLTDEESGVEIDSVPPAAHMHDYGRTRNPIDLNLLGSFFKMMPSVSTFLGAPIEGNSLSSLLLKIFHIVIGFNGWFTGEYSWKCQPVDYSHKPSTVRMVHLSWWYYFSKFTEFFDTLFFVMRKKYDQVSTLHVIHHGVMPMSVWFGVKFTPGGHSTFFGLLNTFVHIIMYFYYMLSAMGPHMQKYLWWKKYLTTLQMAQFVGIMVHAFQLLFIDCNYPRAFVWWIGMHAVMFFFLFKEFYNKAYQKKSKVQIPATGKKESPVGNGHIEEKKSGKSVSEYYVNGTAGIHHRIKSQ